MTGEYLSYHGLDVVARTRKSYTDLSDPILVQSIDEMYWSPISVKVSNRTPVPADVHPHKITGNQLFLKNKTYPLNVK